MRLWLNLLTFLFISMAVHNLVFAFGNTGFGKLGDLAIFAHHQRRFKIHSLLSNALSQTLHSTGKTTTEALLNICESYVVFKICFNGFYIFFLANACQWRKSLQKPVFFSLTEMGLDREQMWTVFFLELNS